MKKNYSDLLKDPRWQKKRLQIMQRDNFQCQVCGDKKSTLNVHHVEYGKTPWDVDDKGLITLCDKCHNEIHSVGSIEIIDGGILSPYDFIQLDPMMLKSALCYIENHKGIWTIEFRKIANPYQIISTVCLLHEFITPCDTNIKIRYSPPSMPDFTTDFDVYSMLDNLNNHEKGISD